MARPDRKSAELGQLTELAAKLSVSEVVIGSTLHALPIPFAGSFLSLNQGFFLCQTSRQASKNNLSWFSPLIVSSLASLLKSLSPVGKRLGPMLAIWCQGFLFNLGTLLGGRNRLGEVFGMALLAPWSFVQPALTYTLFYGADLWRAIKFAGDKLTTNWGISPDLLVSTFCFVLGVKVFAALLVPFVLPQWERLFPSASISLPSQPEKRLSIAAGLRRDLTRPLFLLSFLLFAVYVIFSETDHVTIVWRLLRPIATALLVFWLSRSDAVRRLIVWLGNTSLLRPYFQLLQQTWQQMQKKA